MVLENVSQVKGLTVFFKFYYFERNMKKNGF